MNIEVRYFSKGGNTRKLAEAIARALDIQARDVSEPMSGRADVVFLGASVYAGGPDKAVLTFIRRNARDIGRLVVFSTSATGKSTHAKIKAVAEDCGITVSESYFQCPGAWTLFHRYRPNDEDGQRAAAFAKAQLDGR